MKTQCNYVIFFDFETGGLCSKEKKAFYDVPIVELALVVIDMYTLNIVEQVSLIAQPDYKEGLEYSAKAIETHKITLEMQRENGVDIKEIYKKTVEMFKKYKNPKQMVTLGGHNIMSYDMPFMRNMFEYFGDDVDNYVRYYYDTLSMAHIAALEQDNYQLATCCAVNGIDLIGAHRALADTAANAQLFIQYVARIRGLMQNNSSNKEAGNEVVERFREKFYL